MGRTIEELFKSKILDNGQTAEKKYDIRNSKDIELSSSTGAMNLPFKAAQIARRNLSSRKRETRLEQEVTGLRLISKLAGPVIYGTDILRLSTQKTEVVNVMKDSVNPNNTQNAGLIGNTLNKAKDKALQIASKIGIKFPEQLIPTRVSQNAIFVTGKEPDTMTNLAKIKGDGAGNLVGKLLAQNATGTPKQIGNQVLGAGIGEVKKLVKKKLFGSPKEGAQNFAKKSESQVQYDSSTKYSSIITPNSEDVLTRGDLSSVLKLQELEKEKKLKEPKKEDAKSVVNPGGNKFDLKNSATSEFKKINVGLSGGRKEGQQNLAKKESEKIDTSKQNKYDVTTSYDGTIDERQTDIKLRNDLSTKLQAIQDAADKLVKEGKGKPNSLIPSKQSKTKYSIKIDSQSTKLSLDNRYQLKTKSNLLNEKLPYSGDTLKFKNGNTLDDYDFITLKFYSIAKNKSSNFLATITNLNETVSPTWDSAKFLGSPFNYYNYTGIERSVSFTFTLFSLNAVEHIAMWQRLNFLTELAYPQGYNQGYMTPPFLKVTIGDLYKNKECFIESLSYTVDDNGGWELGGADKTKDDFIFAEEKVKLLDFKLPRLINVDVTLKFVESATSTYEGQLYGFKKLGNKVKIVQTSETSKNLEKTNNSNVEGQTNVSSNANSDVRLTTEENDDKQKKPTLEQPKQQPVPQSNPNPSGQPQSEKVAEVPKVENQSVSKTATVADTKGEYIKAKQIGIAGQMVSIYWSNPSGVYPYGRAAAYDSKGRIIVQEKNLTDKSAAIASVEDELDFIAGDV